MLGAQPRAEGAIWQCSGGLVGRAVTSQNTSVQLPRAMGTWRY